jgi:acetolactate synthase I/II/III large subunit
MTGKAGVAIATSGPGVSNLVTGLATANTEGDPIVAFGGAVQLSDRLKKIHQTMDSVSLCRPVTKYSAEVNSPESVSEVLTNAFRSAESDRPGAAFVSLPMDIMVAPAECDVLVPPAYSGAGPADSAAIKEAARLINQAQRPVLLLGLLASKPQHAVAATVVRPSEKVLSISGDGGFLFSAMELETAVRLKSNLVHMILIDGS